MERERERDYSVHGEWPEAHISVQKIYIDRKKEKSETFNWKSFFKIFSLDFQKKKEEEFL